MGYLGGYRGDYLGGYRGDPGFFGDLWKGVKKVGSTIVGAHPLGGIVKTGAKMIHARFGGGAGTRTQTRMVSPPRGTQGFGGPAGMGMRTLGPPAKVTVDPMTGMVRRKTRRMNVANPKALRRAIRREQGFVKLARRALKGTGYTVVSRGSRARRPVTVRESGPGSVVVR